MTHQAKILDIASELAYDSAFEGGPKSVLSRIKDKFHLDTGEAAKVRQLNDKLYQHTYCLKESSFEINISFLFHATSGRWYVNKVG